MLLAVQGPVFDPTAAARQQLGSEKPAVLQRMEDTVARCRAARDHRNYRLNSLGGFFSFAFAALPKFSAWRTRWHAAEQHVTSEITA